VESLGASDSTTRTADQTQIAKFWSGIGGTSFLVDPAEDLFAMLLTQAPNQRIYFRNLFRSLVYAALD